MGGDSVRPLWFRCRVFLFLAGLSGLAMWLAAQALPSSSLLPIHISRRLSNMKTHVYDEEKLLWKTDVPWNETQSQTDAEEVIGCRFPTQVVDDPSIKSFLKDYSPLKCSSKKNWVYTTEGRFFISSEAEAKFGKIHCNYYDIVRKGDETWDETVHKNFRNGSELLGEVFRVQCLSDSGAKYRNLHVAVPKIPSLLARRLDQSVPRLNMDVYIYLIDSISRVNFMRKLPKFYDLIKNKMNGIIIPGFNIVGDGTPWSLIPIITGHFQTEMYEARKRFSNASFLDDWPLIFKDFMRAGYITSFAEEQPQFSFWSYKLKGFRDPPVDHYLRRFEQAVNWVSKNHKSYCLGDTPRSILLCRYWKEQQDIYSAAGIRTMSMLFSSETSHDDYNYVQVLDDHWTKEFQSQFDEGYFNNSIVFIMGDHGRRFGQIRQTQSGKTEEKLPFLALLTPGRLRDHFPNAYKNLVTNSEDSRLVTPFDLHETLRDILVWPGDDKVPAEIPQPLPRGISLFRNIPRNRTCSDAWIKPHFCSCLEWEDVDPSDTKVQAAARFALKTFNEALAPAKGMCAPLELTGVEWARKMRPNAALMAFKESKDYDNISPDLTADATLHAVVYQLRLHTAPNKGQYEVSVEHYLDLGSFRMQMDEVSRTDMYGEQPHCIMESQAQLRQYCYCKDLLDAKKT